MGAVYRNSRTRLGQGKISLQLGAVSSGSVQPDKRSHVWLGLAACEEWSPPSLPLSRSIHHACRYVPTYYGRWPTPLRDTLSVLHFSGATPIDGGGRTILRPVRRRTASLIPLSERDTITLG
jgi:hypothetical protein